MNTPRHPAEVLYAGGRPFPALAACEHYAGSEKLIRKALDLQAALQADGIPLFDITADCEDGAPAGAEQTAEFTPVASYPGLTADVRARLGEMKVAPVSAEMVAANAPLPEASRDVALPATSVPKAVSTRAKRAEVN